MSAQLRGVCAAVLTPLDADLRPDAATAIPYYRELLQSGCDSLNVLGTTGEAMSISTDDRLQYMEAIANSGLPRERMMVGTGAAALSDSIRLTSAAKRLGFGAALIMPPTFFRGISDDGVMNFFERLIEAVRPAQRGILLYHYPAMSGIAFHPELVDRLMSAYPGIIGGIKDSSNDAALQREIFERHPELLVFPSSEAFLSDARQRGYAGCISGTVALWPELAARVWRGDASAQAELTRNRETLARVPLLAGVRYVIARRTGKREWERAIPPLTQVTNAQADMLRELTVYQASI
jgi:4-hydroxy-tetrahydrodipicolinate synthase